MFSSQPLLRCHRIDSWTQFCEQYSYTYKGVGEHFYFSQDDTVLMHLALTKSLNFLISSQFTSISAAFTHRNEKKVVRFFRLRPLALLVSPSLSLIPQFMLSASLPLLLPNSSAIALHTSTTDHNHATLLSSWDPLSLPAKFKRVVSITRPVFRFEDQMEEIIWGMQERLFGWRHIRWYVHFVPFFSVFVSCSSF